MTEPRPKQPRYLIELVPLEGVPSAVLAEQMPDVFTRVAPDGSRELFARVRVLNPVLPTHPCPCCGATVVRGMEGKRYCSKSCREKACRRRARGLPENAPGGKGKPLLGRRQRRLRRNADTRV